MTNTTTTIANLNLNWPILRSPAQELLEIMPLTARAPHHDCLRLPSHEDKHQLATVNLRLIFHWGPDSLWWSEIGAWTLLAYKPVRELAQSRPNLFYLIWPIELTRPVPSILFFTSLHCFKTVVMTSIFTGFFIISMPNIP